MLALVKIRSIFLKRYPPKIVLYYIAMPITAIIAAIIYKAETKDSEKGFQMNPKQTFNYSFGSEYYFKDKNFNNSDISLFLSNTSLVVKNEQLGNKLVSYIKENANVTVNLYDDEDKLDNNAQNIIVLKYDEKKDSYKFTYKEKEIKKVNTSSNFPFDTELLSSQNAIDVFKYEFNGNYSTIDTINKRFIDYQSFLAKFLIEKVKGKTFNKQINFEFGLNSYPEAVKDARDYSTVEIILGYLIGFLSTFVFLSFSIMMHEEKELKLEEFLKRQGLSLSKYICSIFINFFLNSILANAAIIVGGFITLKSCMGIYILDLILLNLSVFSLMFLILTVSKTKKIGLMLVNIIGFGSLVFGLIFSIGSANKVLQIIFNLFFPNVNICFSVKLITKMQFLGKYSFDYTRLNYNGINYIDTVFMFVFQIIFYFGIALFVRSYQDSGLSFIYFIKSKFKKVSRIMEAINQDKKELVQDINHEELSDKNKSLKEQNLFLSIKNVTKKYDDLVAVNNFNGELFKNEIFVLLGHNGAGKTTLIKMISGNLDPDSGDIFLNNRSVITDKKYLFQNIGLCQQDDIFFDYLTVYEHLKYMMEIKGVKSDINKVNTLINKIELVQKKDALCKTLSGGEKRKLCVALAIIGNSELVLLDEPTSGMDIISKRALWDFLKEFKNDKIIILTTHSLDEAEYLGDRIGIMTHGQYICSGTSSFLKSKYPCGFNINLLINSKICTDSIKQKLYNELIEYEPKLEIKISSKGLFSLNIQYNNQNIKEIFDVITKNKEEYGIEDYTVSSTSLEDVFLKLNHKIRINEEEGERRKISSENLLKVDNVDLDVLYIPQSFFSQLCSHIKRGYFALWRNKVFTFMELLMGLFILYIYIIMYYIILDQQSENVLSFKKLFENNDIYICDNNLDFFEKSYVADDLCSIDFKSVNSDNNKEKFIENIYQNSLGNIGKSGICVANLNSNNGNYEVINSEIPLLIPSYILANSMLTVSAFLKKEYDINAAIFDEIINNKINEVGTTDTSQIVVMFMICFASSFSLNMYLSSIIAEKIKERVKNIKQILYLSGTNMWSYWCGFLVVDTTKMIVFSSLGAAGIYLLNNYASYIWLNLLISIFSSLAFVYALSFLFEKEETGQLAFTLLMFFFILILGVVIIILLVSGSGDLSALLNSYNFTIIDITPITSFALSTFRIAFSYYNFETLNIPEGMKSIDFGRFGSLYRVGDYVITSLIVHIINFVFYSGLLLLIESGYLKQFFNYIKVKYIIKESNVTFSNVRITGEYTLINEEENNSNLKLAETSLLDKDNNENQRNNCIEKEKEKVNNDINNRLTTKITALKKTYCLCCKKNIRAINNLYLGLENNEKFGLLGFNGSGKTTTFKTITREILYDSGKIMLFGKDIKTQFNDIRQSIGYCPQENPLFDYMKVREIIKFYLKLKNVNTSEITICQKFGLEKYIDTYCINLSGGNKRKLSFAIALMCNPKLLLLDEPSTGVDPESRRIMWKNIMETSKKRDYFNMILTTHSMEEAEVLCDTVSR